MGEQDVLKMQQRKDFLIKFCYWAVIAVCIYAVFKYLLPVLFPFVLAYGIAYILAKPVRRIAGESRWKRAFFSILLSAVFFMTVGGGGYKNSRCFYEDSHYGNCHCFSYH